jgi:hypothetical protein
MATKKPAAPAPKASSTAVAVTKRPSYMPALRAGTQRGSEEVDASDLIIPRLEVAQGLSPQLDADKEEVYVEGLKKGDLFNSVTHTIYPKPTLFVPVMYKKDYLIWKLRKFGGGFRGAFATRDDAKNILAAMEDSVQCEIMDTPQQFGIVQRADGKWDEIVISMPRTKAKVSRRLNSAIKMSDIGDRWEQTHNVFSVTEKNARGDYYNLAFTSAGFTTEAPYKMAEQMYKDLSTGRAKASTDFRQPTDDDEEKEY